MTEGITSRRTQSRRTLIEEINNIADIYSYRNRIFMSSFKDRTTWLLMGAKDLFEVVRKGRSPIIQHIAIARVFARIVAVDEYFRTERQHLPFVKMLCQKYPLVGCSYCKEKPCICPPNRLDSSELDDRTLEQQKKWSLDDWQRHLADVYGKVNQDSSWDRMFAHLITEIVEILTVHYTILKNDQDTSIQQFAKELADAFAWTCGVATKMNVSVGAAVELVYRQGCGVCKQTECQCSIHSFDFLDIGAVEARLEADLEVATVPTFPDAG